MRDLFGDTAALPAAGAAARPLQQTLDPLIAQLHSDWLPLVQAWRNSPAGQALQGYLAQRLSQGAVVYPADVFRALALTPLAQTRVVVLGQDPYHGPGQAEGLAFSVPAGQRIPPSLRNIFKQLQTEFGPAVLGPLARAGCGHLGAWARRGVLLLNTSLTVEDGQAGSHAKRGWEALTDAVVAAAAADARPKVFLLWGAHAQSKAGLIEAAGRGHRVLQSNHPSPLSASRGPVPFLGNGHFRAAQAILAEADPHAPPLDWSLD